MRQEVNLYTSDLRPRKEPLVFRQLAWSAAALVVMFAVAGLWLWHRHHALLAEQASLQVSVSALQADDDRLAKAVGAMHIDPALSRSVASLKSDIDQRLRLLSQIHRLSGAGQMGFSPYLTALARQSASDLWLREVVLNGSTGDVTLSGRTTKPEAVPDYLERLRQEAAFKGKSFAEFDMQRDDKKPILDFVLSTQGKDAVGAKQ